MANQNDDAARGLRFVDAEAVKTKGEPWWHGSVAGEAETVAEATATETARTTIPLPPQILEKQKQAEARRVATERAEALKRDIARKDDERRRAQTAREAASVQCAKCGMTCNNAPGQAFSFCTACGTDLPAPAARPLRTGAEAASVRAQAAAVRAAAPPMGQVRVATMSAEHTTHETSRGYASPGTSAILSFFVPGLGQLLNGQVEKGVLLLLGLYIATALLGLGGFGLPLLLARIVASVDAYRIAQRRFRGETVRTGEWDIS